MKYIFLIIKIILLFLALTFLELNRNTLLGWGLSGLLICVYIYLYRKTQINKALLFLLSILLFGAIVYISWPPYRYVPAVSNANPELSDVIVTDKGKVQGVLNKDESVAVYAGIPYAKPPVGELRWKEPEDPQAWSDTLLADHFGPLSMQETNLPIYDSLVRIVGYHDYQVYLKDNYREPVSEDSLYLNVFKPNKEVKDLPVLVFIHGGSLQNGRSSSAEYNGENIAREDVVFVSLTYRLGVFGFMADEQLQNESLNHTTGNYGLLDTIKALEWVNRNIAAFGGDPNNVTIAGESAGAALVSALCTSPLAEGLFERAVMESSTAAASVPPHSYRSLEDALSSGKKLKERYGVSSIDELRNIPAEDLVKELASQHHMTVDGYALTEDPYQSYKKGIHNESAIFHGYNSLESGPFILFEQGNMSNYEGRIRRFFGEYADEVLALFSPENDEEAKEYWADIYSTIYFSYSHYCLNRLAVENKIPVYEYYFSKQNGGLGPWHTGEMIYLYHNMPDNAKNYRDDDIKLSDMMNAYLLNFVRTGDPNCDDLPEWPVNKNSDTLMEFGKNVDITNDRFKELYAIYDRMYGFE